MKPTVIPALTPRAIALAAGAVRQLARIGVWRAISDCATAINTKYVSDRGHAGFVTRRAGLQRQRWVVT
ncbi:hypothetical protein KCP76_05145 [Salmonella enterica subsp. enterica serovar Weltevreden]|nr:hypothetical protein KCP76_05145 [Salmonella enterica subsp. enterica serovar Weltevreden]